MSLLAQVTEHCIRHVDYVCVFAFVCVSVCVLCQCHGPLRHRG